MRRYGVIGLMTAATVATIAVTRNSVGNQPATADSEHSSHAQMNGMEHSSMPGMSHDDAHGEHGSNANAVTTQATLTTSGNLTVNQPSRLTIAVQDAQGKAISKFET